MNIPSIAQFARRGYVVAVAQYRPSTVATFPAQVVDIKAAVKFMKKNAAQYGIDPEQCFVWGDSSGGHTVAMLGVTGDDILPCPDDPEASVAVRGVIDFFGPSDIARMSEFPSVMDHTLPTSPEGFLLGGINVFENKEKAAAAAPQTYITKERRIPPFLLVHGDCDKIVPFGQSVLLYEKLRDTGKKVDFYKLEGADHGSGEFSSSAVYDLMEAFIKENI
jgi:acetyl esterase/lipase